MIKLVSSAVGTGAVIALVGASYFYTYNKGESFGRLQAQAEHREALAAVRAEAAEKEAEHKQAVASIIAGNEAKIEESKNEIDNLINQLSSRNRVHFECPDQTASGGVPESGAAAAGINGQEGDRAQVDTRRLKEAAAECRKTELMLAWLQEWAKSAVQLCNGGTKTGD